MNAASGSIVTSWTFYIKIFTPSFNTGCNAGW